MMTVTFPSPSPLGQGLGRPYLSDHMCLPREKMTVMMIIDVYIMTVTIVMAIHIFILIVNT